MSTKEGDVTKGIRKTRRGVIGGHRGRLNIRGTLDPAYEYRIVNDKDAGDRIGWFKDNDWEIVNNSDLEVGDKKVDKPTAEGTPVKISVGQGMHAYLMRKPKEWFDEDQAFKQVEITKQESQMKPSDTYGTITVGKPLGKE